MNSFRIAFADESDATQMLEIYAPYVIETSVTFEYEPPSPGEFARRIQAVRKFHPWIKCEDQGRVFGYGYAHYHHERKAYQWNAELSVYLRQDMTGGGLGRAIYHALIELSRLQGFYNLYGILGLPNEASERFHRAFGFERIAVFKNDGYKLGEWHDVVWYGRCLREGPPSNPRSVWDIPAEDTARVLAESQAILDGAARKGKKG